MWLAEAKQGSWSTSGHNGDTDDCARDRSVTAACRTANDEAPWRSLCAAECPSSHERCASLGICANMAQSAANT
jgi:hypothetical protein